MTAYSNQDQEFLKAPLLVSSLGQLFQVESFPDVSLPKKKFFAEVGIVSEFKLKKKNPNQSFKIDWDMGDGITYKDAGRLGFHKWISV